MTIRLLCAWDRYPANAIVTLDAGTEAGLIAAKVASSTTTGGVLWVPPVEPVQARRALVDTTGKLLADGGVSVYRRVLCANGNGNSITEQADSNTVHHFGRWLAFSSGATWSNIVAGFPGYVFFGSETPISAGFKIRVAYWYMGKCYPATFNGQSEWTFVAGTATIVEHDPVKGLVVAPGTRAFRVVRMETGGGAKLISSEGYRSLGDLVHHSTNTALDYTTTTWPGSGARGYWTINGSGAITGLTTTYGGSGWPAGDAQVFACDPDVNPESGTFVGWASSSNGVLNTGASSASSAGPWGKFTFPVYGQHPTPLGMYDACWTTGEPDQPAIAVAGYGDSNLAAYGASPKYGSGSRDIGIYERWLARRGALVKLAYPGAPASFWANPANSPLTRQVEKYCTHALIQGGGNDIGANVNAGAVINTLLVTADYCRAKGMAISYPSPFPRTTGAWTSAGAQTPAPGFGAGGEIDKLTYAIVNERQGLTRDWGFLDLWSVLVDPANPNVWRSDGGQWTDDGSHLNRSGEDRAVRLLSAPYF